MLWRNTEQKWGAVSKTFHWLVFLLVAGMLAVGFYMTGLGKEDMELKLQLIQMHKSTGVVVLTLMLARLTWRLANTVPTYPSPIKAWERIAAKSLHYAFYILLIAMPLAGWVMVSSAGRKLSVFGLVSLPQIVSANEYVHEIAEEVHETLAWVIIAAVVLHIGAALYHHYIKRNDVLLRMLPGNWSR